MDPKIKIKVKIFPDGSCCAEVKEPFKELDRCQGLLKQMGFKLDEYLPIGLRQDIREGNFLRFSSYFGTAIIIREACSYKNRIPDQYIHHISIYPYHAHAKI